MKSSALLVAFILSSFLAVGQDYPVRDYNFEILADELFPVQDLDLDYSQLYENLAQILSNPIDLNKATEEQLRSLYILNESQIHNLIRYRDEQGTFLSVYELQAVPGFDQNTISKFIPFVTVDAKSQSVKSVFNRILNERNSYFISRYERTLETKRGFLEDTTSSSNYKGTPDRLYHRFRVAHAGDFSLGFTLEKDAGEIFQWSPAHKQFGFDYTSFHVQKQNVGKIKNVVLGDFQAQFGQGLVLGGGFGIGKGSESITTVRRSNLGFLPYTSLNESGFLRGIALTANPAKNLSLSGFASRVFKDGTFTADSTNTIVSSLSTTGYHRTQNEIDKRNKLEEINFGAVLSYRLRSLETGVIVHQTQFGSPIHKTTSLYNQFTFQGDNNTNASLFLNYNFGNFTFFSEAAHTIRQGNAIIAGILGNLSPAFDISILYRRFEKNFYSFYSNAFSESTNPQNEYGYYTGWKYKFNKKHQLSGYLDLFQFPWLRFRGYAPSQGSEWLIRYTVQPSKNILFFVQVREESKIRNLNSDNLYQTTNGIKRNYWINLDYTLTPRLSFKSRVQFSTYQLNAHPTSGFALIQDLNFDLGKVSFATRYALFDTDDFDNRQYVYERDVWLAYSFPFYNGVGVRNYVVMKYELSRRINIWLRWARTNYSDRNTIGTGSELIQGNSKNDIKLQALLRL